MIPQRKMKITKSIGCLKYLRSTSGFFLPGVAENAPKALKISWRQVKKHFRKMLLEYLQKKKNIPINISVFRTSIEIPYWMRFSRGDKKKPGIILPSFLVTLMG